MQYDMAFSFKGTKLHKISKQHNAIKILVNDRKFITELKLLKINFTKRYHDSYT